MRILAAEDDSRLLKSLLHILEKENYSADGVSNGKTECEKNEKSC
ncbi:MAG: hypothetical protein SOZ59_01285 [Candidatus Limivivens sp.]|nr:hypothetical protein [Candidatus Limivivens sp.]